MLPVRRIILPLAGLLVLLSSVPGPKKPVTLAAIKDLVESKKPKTIDAFLSELETSSPELFSSFTLMRESQSLQSSTPQNPRAIVFGQDAKFVLTFNGSPDQAGYYNLEMMIFQEASFELRELRFDPKGFREAELSMKNPPKCTRCHGTDPKPIWEEYDRWPGAYGEDDDALIDFDKDLKPGEPPRQDNPKIKLHRQHLKEFKDFFAAKDQHPRYKFLKFPEGTTSPVAPYTPMGRTGRAPLRPNLRLTQLFAGLNAEKVARQLHHDRSGQCFNDVAPMLVALALDCDNVDQTKEHFRRIRNELAALPRSAETTGLLPSAPWKVNSVKGEHQGFINLLNIAGVSDFDWSPAKLKPHWRYDLGFLEGSEEIVRSLWPELKRRAKNLPAFFTVLRRKYPDAKIYTDYYQYGRFNDESESANLYSALEDSCSAFMDMTKNVDAYSLVKNCRKNFAQQKSGLPSTIKMCMSCHDGSFRDAPSLPLYHQEELLKNRELVKNVWIRIHATNGQQMPPTRPLTIGEEKELREFLGGEVFSTN